MHASVPGVVAFLLVARLSDGAAQQPQRLSEPGVSPAVWGVLELPTTPGPHYGVVLLPGSGGWRTQNWPGIARVFADSGFAALAIDYYAGTGPDTSPADARLKRPVWHATIRNAVAYLLGSASLGRPVALVGFSRGAFLAVDVATSTPGVAAVVDFFGGGPAEADSLRARVHGFPPLLIVHGDADTVVKVTEAYRLRDAVAAQGGPLEMRIYPGADHGFTKPPGVLADAFGATARFLRAHASRPDSGRKP